MSLGLKALFGGPLLGAFLVLRLVLATPLVFSRRRRCGETFLQLLHLVNVRLFPLHKVQQRRLEDGIRRRRCFCHGGECCSSRHVERVHDATNVARPYLGLVQSLFDAVSCRACHGSQGGRFGRSDGGGYECQEGKESPSLTHPIASRHSFFDASSTTSGDATHGSSRSSSSRSSLDRNDVS